MELIEAFAELGRTVRKQEQDIADIYEERFVRAFHSALSDAIASIKNSLTPQPNWLSLYSKLDMDSLASLLAQGDTLATLLGRYSERPDREDVEFVDVPTNLPFDKAIAYFRQKLNIPTKDWKTIQGEENDWAFGVAGVTNAEMLQDFSTALDQYIADGIGFDEFKKNFEAIAENYGWQPKQGIARRADLVAQTNFRMAYAAGQWQQRQDPIVKQQRPGLLWRHRDSPNPRPHHLAMDGMVFDGNDPQYAGMVCPSGYGCRCRLFSVPMPDDGFDKLSDRLPYELPDGDTTEIPAVNVGGTKYAIADPGFFYAPGASPADARDDLLRQMIERQPPEWRKAIREAIG